VRLWCWERPWPWKASSGSSPAWERRALDLPITRERRRSEHLSFSRCGEYLPGRCLPRNQWVTIVDESTSNELGDGGERVRGGNKCRISFIKIRRFSRGSDERLFRRRHDRRKHRIENLDHHQVGVSMTAAQSPPVLRCSPGQAPTPAADSRNPATPTVALLEWFSSPETS
jgi:hypothetical protein